MQAFARAVLAGKPDAPTLRDAWRAMQVCEAMLDSIEQGGPVTLGQ
jgi:predicted dehydrogenase